MLPYAPWLCWFVPILGTAITMLVSVIRRKLSSYLAVLSIGISALFSFSMIPNVLDGKVIDLKTPWLYSQMGVLVDPLSVLMACVITCIGLLVTIFSVAYMKEDPSLARFWFLIQLFIGGYIVIVMANNLLFMFIGWEIVGLCCTGLAAFWYKDPEKAHVGLKTFMILRVADVLLLASILLIYVYSSPQTLNIKELAENNNLMVELSKSGMLFITALMFFGGAVGKAAQFPLHEWLPDALTASPSCFNALTECLAGPFLIARILPIFHEASIMKYNGIIDFFLVMAFIGALTSVISALIAMAQDNIFKVLSYSVSSVIGYMIAAFGLAGLMNDLSLGYLAGTFLLTIDGFVSALLFLTAAYISYTVGSDNLHLMSRFKSRIAHTSMEVGAIAIAGMPPLSGFWCTNWIQNVALDFAAETGSNGQFMLMLSGYVIFGLLIVGGGITAFYALRMMGLVFGGEAHTSEGDVSKNPPPLMRISLAVTLIITAFLDFLALLLISPFNTFLLPGQLVFANLTDVLVYLVPSVSTVLTCVAVAVGGFPAYKIYVKRTVDAGSFMESHGFLKAIHKFLQNRFYIDAFYHKVAYSAQTLSHRLYSSLEHGLNALNFFVASFLLFLSRRIYNGLEHGFNTFNNFIASRFLFIANLTYKYVETEGIAKPDVGGFSEFFDILSRRLISFSRWAYPYVELGGFDSFNQRLAKIVVFFSRKIRKIQTGVLSYNMLTVALGIVLVIILIMKFGGML